MRGLHMTAALLWAAVEASYDAAGLVTLTNIRNPAAVVVNGAAGTNAAQGVVDLWPIYAQAAWDGTVAVNLEVGKRAVIAMLWSRGGTAASIAKVEWDEVFGDNGLISKVRGTGPRGRPRPVSNSGVTQKSETLEDGRRVRGWSDQDSLPSGILPATRPAE